MAKNYVESKWHYKNSRASSAVFYAWNFWIAYFQLTEAVHFLDFQRKSQEVLQNAPSIFHPDFLTRKDDS